jgi:hypothetical protein
MILGVPARTPNAAVLGDLGWRVFSTRAAYQCLCMWTRVTEMDEAALVRQALCMQRAALERVLNPQVQRRQVRERRVDSFSFNLKIWKANTWLWWV